MALAKGTSKINLGRKNLTSHTKTAIEVTNMILNQFNVHFKLNEKKNGTDISYSLECEGNGYENIGTK